jgi:integrase/recombinase XerD
MINFFKFVAEYLTLRRQLGFELNNAEHVLKEFVAYMKQKKRYHITAEIALEFATKNNQSSLIWQAKKLAIVRDFASYLCMYDAKTEVPSKDLLSNTYHRRPPYIFSDEEIIKLLDACLNLFINNPMKARTYYVFLGLIAVTGMRTSEALELCRDSIDLDKGIITIFESKFRKSRKIPVHASTIKILKEYSEFRDQQIKKKISEYFFVNDRGQKLTSYVRDIFKKACALAGIHTKGKFHLRILDLRHTLAVKTLVNCYKTGINADTVMPALAMYLGHENPKHTYWYLSATPELMGLVIDRLEKKIRGK